MSRIVPAEWAPHKAFWLGFPSHEDLWVEDLLPAQAEVAALARALAGPGRERVRLMVHGDAAEAAARAALEGTSGVEIVRGLFGDVWLRDTGPIFVKAQKEGAEDGREIDLAVGFRFNGWGGKYELPYDDQVAEQIAAAAGAPLAMFDAVLEGGALDSDGAGTVLTTRQCLLNPNRNLDWTETQAEGALASALGFERVLWLGDGLLNDHTDGHVDNLARFIAPGVVACPIAFGDDPNADVYDAAADRLAAMTDAKGARLQVVRIPSPGRIEGAEGEPAPASHMNFIIANGAVVMPVYAEQSGEAGLEALRRAFPDRQVIGLSSRALLSGGGSFHCISQQEPA
jgi:agmatine deiminase